MPPREEARRLVLDEDINWKLSIDLRRRGFHDATSVRELGWANQSLKDGGLIKRLAETCGRCVLVAWDNKMPVSHRAVLDNFELTLAVVGQVAGNEGLTEEEYYRDVIHRHAHRMAVQPQGTRFSYWRRARRGDLTR